MPIKSLKTKEITATSRKEFVYIGLIRILYYNTKIAISIGILSVLILLFFLNPIVDHRILYTWVALQFSISFIRLLHARQFKKKSRISVLVTEKYEMFFMLFALLSGVAWGSIVFFPLQNANSNYDYFLMMFVLGGVIVGASSSMSTSLRSFSLFLACTASPILYRLLSLHERDAYIMALFVLIFSIFIFIVTFQNSMNISLSFDRLYQNRGLIKKLVGLNFELRQEKKISENALLARGFFLASMSHEIRNPIHCILGYTNLILDSEPDQDTRRNLKVIAESGQHLLTIISDILEYSAVESGKITLYPTNFLVNDVLFEIGEMFQPIASAKNLDLVIESASPVNFEITLDKSRFRQILINLVSNAIKYTEKGSVIVRYQCNQEKGEYVINLSIQDSGIGIPKDKQPQVFQIYSRIASPLTNKETGTGLGLAITKSLVENMSGQIWFSSEEDLGTDFNVRIPLSECSIVKPFESYLEILNPNVNCIVALSEVKSAEYLCHVLGEIGVKPVNHPMVNLDLSQLKGWLDSGSCIFLDSNLLTSLLDYNSSLSEQNQIQLNTFQKFVIQVLNFRDNADSGMIQKNIIRKCIRKPFSLKEILISLEVIPEEVPGQSKPRKTTDSMQAKRNFSKTVLIVDDNEINRQLLRIILEKNEFNVIEAKTGLEAIYMHENHPCDMILMDTLMPEMNGIEATLNIRKKEEETKNRVPILALSANNTKEDIILCIDSGCDGYMLKPYDTKKIIEVIDYFTK